MKKEYLGDGVYIQMWLDGGVLLATEDGVNITNVIVLEPEVIAGMLDYIERRKGEPDAG